VTRRYRFRPGLAEIFPLRDHPGAHMGVAAGGLGVEADHEPFMVADPHFLDAHVPGDIGVAALAGQRGLDLGRSGAQFLPDDVVVIPRSQVAAVLR